MRKIFICYRRADAEYAAGALGRELREHFGEEQVFRDKEDIGGGEAWKRKVLSEIDRDSALLVLIGPRWLDAKDVAGGRRIDDPGDPIRMEVHDGIRDGAAIIPILLENAAMPRSEDLPPELGTLADYNALKLHDSDWQYNLQRILKTLEKAGFAPVPGRSPAGSPRTAAGGPAAPVAPLRWSGKTIAGGVLVLLALIGLADASLDNEGHLGAAAMSVAALVAGLWGLKETTGGRAKGRGLAIAVSTLAVVALLASIGGMEDTDTADAGGAPAPAGSQDPPAGPAPQVSGSGAGAVQHPVTQASTGPAAPADAPEGTGGSASSPIPQVERPAPAAAATRPDISGLWTDDEDSVFEFTQDGQAVHMAGVSTEGITFEGEGTLTGRQLRMQLKIAEQLTLQVAMTLSPDGRELRGTMTGAEGTAPVVLQR